MKQSIESGYTNSAGRRFYMFKEGREPSDDFALIQRFGDFEKCLQRQVCFRSAARPRVTSNLIQGELTFESHEHSPLKRAQSHNSGLDHVRRLRRSGTW